MILYDLTPDLAASEGHASPPTNGDIELKFAKALPEAVTCLLYLEYDNSVRIDLARNVSTDLIIIDTLQIQHALQNVNSFLGVYASDLLPLSIVQTGTIIVNTVPHTEPGLHWQVIYFQNPHRTSNGYFFDSYGRYPFIPSIRDFIRRHCTVWQYNRTQLQGPTTTICGEYCCLFALYMDRGYTPNS